MVIRRKDCMEHMEDEERIIYQEKSATDYFRYLYDTERFQKAMERLDDDDWNYLFEKLYLVNYKALGEEESHVALDGALYLFCKLGTFLTRKDTPMYNEFYKMFQLSRSVFRLRQVNDDLLFGLEWVLESLDERNLGILLSQHEEACRVRNNRDYMVREDAKSPDGVLSTGQIVAINSFNRSFEKEKRLVLKYKKCYNLSIDCEEE